MSRAGQFGAPRQRENAFRTPVRFFRAAASKPRGKRRRRSGWEPPVVDLDVVRKILQRAGPCKVYSPEEIAAWERANEDTLEVI
jgi:hypothetical protein